MIWEHWVSPTWRRRGFVVTLSPSHVRHCYYRHYQHRSTGQWPLHLLNRFHSLSLSIGVRLLPSSLASTPLCIARLRSFYVHSHPLPFHVFHPHQRLPLLRFEYRIPIQTLSHYRDNIRQRKVIVNIAVVLYLLFENNLFTIQKIKVCDNKLSQLC